jgi:hypothetical protein
MKKIDSPTLIKQTVVSFTENKLEQNLFELKVRTYSE